MTVQITDAFDGGNIVVRSLENLEQIQLEIRKDAQSDFYQWFYYRLSGARGQECVMKLTNAGGAAYAPGWTGYQAVASYDRKTWFRVATSYRDGALTIRHRPERDAVYYAYFAPYSMERHADLISRMIMDARVRLTVPGRTLDGQDLDVLEIGNSDRARAKKIWVIGRQHPGETMAEWLIEGMLERLLDRNDPVARVLLEKAVFYVAPNMNPDGSRRGHLRTNAVGTNLNRAWAEPDLKTSPEVFLIRAEMQKTGLDFCLDVHGDEELPYNFVATAQGIPSWDDRLHDLTERYKTALVAASPDFQTEKGYPSVAPGKANLTMCTSWVSEHFKALALTLEQPFKDTTATASPVYGWSPARAKILGRAQLDAVFAVIDQL
ncbi:M14 family metallopeptidase [Govanella unica]|uniref:M14-type cytosolic carboxypeptidase n=1 Tax=Govanella unica TaxID=2975056 RepID=A0A9X3U1E5_9PROT|nr:M14-type cytosolic carboxypeptidase [Govania unica]MDA5194799.1 M14-type cytosolic carboxypeptidase [Govania unica]